MIHEHISQAAGRMKMGELGREREKERALTEQCSLEERERKTWTLTSSKALETYRPPQCTEAASNVPLIQLTVVRGRRKLGLCVLSLHLNSYKQIGLA